MASGWAQRKPANAAATARKQQYNTREHRDHRRAGQRQVDAGTAHCWRCGRWLPPGCTWHVGHDDHDRSITRGTECVTCNLRAAATKGARIANARRKAGLAPQRSTPRRQTRHW